MKLQKETFTRALRRSALPVFIELAFNYPDSLSQKEIAARADIGINQVSKAIIYMESVGVVVRNGRYSVRLTPGILSEFLSLFPVDNFVDNAAALFGSINGNHLKSDSESPEKWLHTDHDHVVDHHTYEYMEQVESWEPVDKSTVIERLEALDPPFASAESFVRRYSTGLITAWLDYVDGMKAKDIRRLNSTAALINGKVRRGEHPPAVATQEDKLRQQIPDEYKGIIKR